MKFSLMLTSLVLVLSVSSKVHAQSAKINARLAIENAEVLQASLSQTLSTFVKLSSDLIAQNKNDVCPAVVGIRGMATSIEKRALENAVAQGEGNAKQFQEYLNFALAQTECFATNDKCCKKSGDATVSDVCNVLVNKDCYLTGFRVQNCTASSFDCP